MRSRSSCWACACGVAAGYDCITALATFMTRSAICDLNRRDLWGCGDRRTLVALLVYGVFSKAASKALRSKRISNFENTPWNKTNELQVQVIRRLADLGLSNSPALILRLNEKKRMSWACELFALESSMLQKRQSFKVSVEHNQP